MALFRKAQVSMISIVIIAGVIIALAGAAYVWAVPMIEKRETITDYGIAEDFMVELAEKITEIANSGSGEYRMKIPRGTMTIHGYDYVDDMNNTLILNFSVSQPIMAGGSIPIKTSNIDYVGEYGKAEPRILRLNNVHPNINTDLSMTMHFRELRSTSNGFIIAVCDEVSVDCSGKQTGSNEVIIEFRDNLIEPRDPLDGGDLTVTRVYIHIT